MARKKATRKELLKSPDEFMTFSSRAIEFYRAHQKQFQYAGMAVCLIILAYLGFNTYMRYVNRKGQAAYNEAYYTLMKKVRPNMTAQDLKKAEELFDKVRREYGLSKAARLAIPQVAYGKFAEKKYDEAIALYREFLENVSGDREYESLTLLALGACYESKGDLKAAMDILNPLIHLQDNPFRDMALMSLARLYRLENRPEKEKELLKQLVEQYPESPYYPIAKSRL